MAVANRLANSTTATVGMSNWRWIGHRRRSGLADSAGEIGGWGYVGHGDGTAEASLGCRTDRHGCRTHRHAGYYSRRRPLTQPFMGQGNRSHAHEAGEHWHANCIPAVDVCRPPLPALAVRDYLDVQRVCRRCPRIGSVCTRPPLIQGDESPLLVHNACLAERIQRETLRLSLFCPLFCLCSHRTA